MRKENDLNVGDVSIHRLKAAQRTSPGDALHDSFDAPPSLLTRAKDYWMAIKQADTVPVPKWVFVIFLGVLVAVGGFLYKKLDDVGDRMIRVETKQDSMSDNLNDRLKPIERQGLLNDEHQRELENKFAEFKGSQAQSGRN